MTRYHVSACKKGKKGYTERDIISRQGFRTNKSEKMSEKIFQSKKEVLEYLGKNPNDRRLVDRMIAKGEIEKRDGEYVLFEKGADAETEALRKEVEELKKKVAGLELDVEIRDARIEELNQQAEERDENDYHEARVQRLYNADEYEKEKKDKEFRIRKCFQWIKARNPKANWEEFRERVMSNDE